MTDSKKRRILFVLDGLFLGGVARNTLNLAEELASQGHEVEIVAFSDRGELGDSVPGSVRVRYLNWPRSLCILPLAMLFRRENFDLVISAKEFVNVSVIIARKLSKNSSPLVVTTRTHLSIEAQRIRNLKLRLIHWLSARLYHEADHIVAVSAGVADDMATYLGLEREKIKVIYNPCVRDWMFNHVCPEPHPWFRQSAEPVIVGCGRLVKQKNFELLVRAFVLVRDQIPCRLLILGEGPERKGLESLIQEYGISECCELVGYVENPLDYILWARVYVSASDYEGFGNTIAEALAVGTPVVATDCPSGPAEILGFGEFGRLVRVGEPQQLASATIAELQNSKSSSQNLKVRAQQFTARVAAGSYLVIAE